MWHNCFLIKTLKMYYKLFKNNSITFQPVARILTFEFDELNHFSDCLVLFFRLEGMLF